MAMFQLWGFCSMLQELLTTYKTFQEGQEERMILKQQRLKRQNRAQYLTSRVMSKLPSSVRRSSPMHEVQGTATHNEGMEPKLRMLNRVTVVPTSRHRPLSGMSLPLRSALFGGF